MADTKNESETTLSPTGEGEKSEKGEVLMNFSQAVEVVLVGKKVHKLDWKDRNYYGVLESGTGGRETLHLHKPDGKLYPWILSRGDLAGKDYVIID